ncbi:MAG: hypothetical protein E7587_05215 [Ruminococcaceae bacterium]|nr:hypothetical protein [Oscillospiraceae bacterium]
MENFKLPVGVAIRVDDVGWFEGADDRHIGRPSRSGLPRRHHPNDILVLNEIGKGLGTKVLCNLILGEWDFKNRLRGVPHVTWDEKGWDAASVVEKNRDFFEAAFSALEDSEYLEYGLHGLMHGYYIDGELHDERYLYPFEIRNEKGEYARQTLPLDEFDTLLTLFEEIYNDWGFKKKYHVFETGNGCFGTPYDDFNKDIAKMLQKHGIGIWEWGGWPDDILSQDGMLFVHSARGFVTWNAYGIDPSILYNVFDRGRPPRVVPNLCAHLTNFVQFQPENNFKTVSAWVDYFRRITSPFGAMMCRDNEQSASQSLYSAYASVDKVDGGYRIDLSPVEAVRTPILEDDFFVSIKDKSIPKSCEGGKLYIHDVRPDHVIYHIYRDKGASVVTVKMQ